MSGTKVGGIKAAKLNKERYGADFYKKIGKTGGTNSRGGGFALNHILAVEAGKKGGLVSRRRRIENAESRQEG